MSLPNPLANCSTHPLIYQPLDQDRSEIRLLKLEPGAQDAEIHCRLVHASLKDKPRYEALSYTWGDVKNNRRDIWVHGHAVSISMNLEIALRHLRKPNEPRTLWVDAVCINQGDLAERSRQVQRMRDIFWSAQQVLAWTGEPDDDEGDEALELLRALGQPSAYMYFYELAAKPMALLSINFNRSWGKFESLFKFLNRPYWSRIWVVQELAIPGSAAGDVGWLDHDKVQVRCNSAWVPYSTFNLACASLVQLIPGIMSSVACLNQADPASRVKPAGLDMFGAIQSCIPTTSRQRLSIAELMHMTHFLKATDPRDRIYALIALARDEDRVLVPDYSVSTAQMLRELARHLILTDNNLTVLSGNRFTPSNTTDDESSSWAPDPEKFISSPKADWDPIATAFNASESRVPAVAFSADLRLLTAKGIIVDRITTVIGPFEFKKFPGLLSEDLHTSELGNSLRELEQYGSSLSSTNERDAFWRTLVLDSGTLGHGRRVSPAPQQIGEWFDVVLDGSGESDAVRFEATKLFYAQAGFTDRCFYATAAGGKGVGPHGTLSGDLVTVLYGGKFCYILREVGDRYVFVGDAYLHGAMHGELFDPSRQGDYKERDFVLC
ncbi:MAG: hypothetical protein M1840_000962 [Geoglossum simile]|nr:MAG: hypothetical protein M1840_000962 [Geoglossum simile]